MPINVPIILTWLRIAMIPLVVGLFYLPDSWMAVTTRDTLAAWAFIIAALTDWFDGWLAVAGTRPRRSAPSSIRWPTS